MPVLTAGLLFLSLAVQQAPRDPPPLALVGARVYVAPGEAPLEGATVLVRAGRIESVGAIPRGDLPPDARVIECSGRVVTAGFWNCHVHFFRPEWLRAAERPASELQVSLREMLTRHGFTTVLDLGSFLENTLALRRRIEACELLGPRILTAGEPIFAREGTPLEVRPHRSPEVDTPEAARAAAERALEQGADLLKLYMFSPTGGPETPVLSAELARAACERAHAAGKIVVAHAENRAGLESALAAGVDVLAHATEDGPWPEELVQRLRRADVALVPTLYLYKLGLLQKGRSQEESDAYLERCGVLEQVRLFARSGGTLLFGTDAGFFPEPDLGEEFLWLETAGLDFPAILASLTTGPATRLGLAGSSARVAPGYDADLVVLAADPREDAVAFTRVLVTVRGGRILFSE